jgi:hypothetical protein
MNPLSAWLFFAVIFKAARVWDRRQERRRALFESFMRTVFR